MMDGITECVIFSSRIWVGFYFTWTSESLTYLCLLENQIKCTAYISLVRYLDLNSWHFWKISVQPRPPEDNFTELFVLPKNANHQAGVFYIHAQYMKVIQVFEYCAFISRWERCGMNSSQSSDVSLVVIMVWRPKGAAKEKHWCWWGFKTGK